MICVNNYDFDSQAVDEFFSTKSSQKQDIKAIQLVTQLFVHFTSTLTPPPPPPPPPLPLSPPPPPPLSPSPHLVP